MIPIRVSHPRKEERLKKLITPFRTSKRTEMSDQTTPETQVPVDLYAYFKIFLNPDGTLTRDSEMYPTTPPTPYPTHPSPVLSKDITINPLTKTWARIFLPKQVLSSTSTKKLPLVVYFHGGGFIILSAASTGFHVYCSNLANELPAVVVSVDYRLAPEHRLPAAYDDALEALHWVKNSEEVCLREYVDFNSCFLMGSSAGANMAYQAGLRVAESVNDFQPLNVKGLILQQPFFGGTPRTGAELRNVNDPILPPGASDMMWDLSLPRGVDRDHEYCNPTVGGGSRFLDEIASLGWRVHVSGCEGDPLIDHQKEVVKLMEGKGIKVERRFVEGGSHGMEVMEPSKAKPGFVALKEFIASA